MGTGEVARHIVDGNLFQRGGRIAAAAASRISNINLKPIFQRWVIVDTIFDPYVVDQAAITQLNIKYKDTPIENLHYAEGKTLPRNTIIARPILNLSQGSTVGINSLMFLYPFFPSSLSLPCKPGEHVWVLFEHLTESDDLGYWICSITGQGEVDDVNHTHYPRVLDGSFTQGEGDANKWFEDEYGGAPKEEGSKLNPRYHFKNGSYFLQDPDIYERILSSSQGSLASVYEQVPRFRKRPGDIAFEGSNNTLIVLGRDRTGSVATYFSGSVDTNDVNLKKFNAGSIDIVAGRGEITGPNQTGGVSVVNDLKNIELSKHKSNESTGGNEGNPDFKNDRSRIYVSQNTNVDKNLSINKYNNQFGINDSLKGDAGIIIKSDKIRIIARSDVQILVTGYNTDVLPTGASKDSNGELIKAFKTEKSQESQAKVISFASIMIKSNGDIIFSPSDEGYIKLGGEDADRGIVCTATPVIATGGIIIGNPLLTSMGGQFAGASGGPPDGPNTPGIASPLGTFSNKVLIK